MSRSMNSLPTPRPTFLKIGDKKTPLHLAVLILVLALVGDINSHYCFDGQEPPVSVHFENLNGHPDHQDQEQQHSDVEREVLSDILLTKAPDQDQPLFVSALLFLFALVAPTRQQAYPDTVALYLQIPTSLRPPLRAPPRSSR